MPPKRMEPVPGQESVWDYPRPPIWQDVARHIQIVFNGVTLADTYHARRVLETSHPPVYYLPREDISMQYLTVTPHHSFCEWKGTAGYVTVEVNGKRVEDVGWFYPAPTSAFEGIRNYIAFYAVPMDACFVDSERVTPQPGGFYGGWITADVVGPFKGEPGTLGW